jgi:CheY-like chemotaxis protein
MRCVDAPSPRGQSRPRVLCVDDEPHVVSALADSLRQKFHVTTATSGAVLPAGTRK